MVKTELLKIIKILPNLNTLYQFFPLKNQSIFISNESTKAKDLIYNYRGMKLKGTRNEAGWNSVYVA